MEIKEAEEKVTECELKLGQAKENLNLLLVETEQETPTCCVCGTECFEDPDCSDCWVCPDTNCSVHDEED